MKERLKWDSQMSHLCSFTSDVTKYLRLALILYDANLNLEICNNNKFASQSVRIVHISRFAMSDITNLFKATIKTVKSRNKHLNAGLENDKNRILASSRPKTEFAIKSRDVVTSITKLRDFLLEHRRSYLDVENHLKNDGTSMRDAERDQIDADSQTLIQTCSEAIRLIRMEVSKEVLSPHVREHREAVIALMQNYLKGVCKIYSEQRAVRVKRVVDKKRIGRLEPERRQYRPPIIQNGVHKSSGGDAGDSRAPLTSPAADGGPMHKSTPEPVKPGPLQSSGTRVPVVSPVSGQEGDTNPDDDDDDELSPEEAQMFEDENQQLYEEMNSMMDEVRQIEGKVVEISRLQEIFADKVLQQEGDIDRIAHMVVGTTENVKEGNEQVREAMKNNAGFRVMILFFLVVCSFSLLFLDWYNA